MQGGELQVVVPVVLLVTGSTPVDFDPRDPSTACDVRLDDHVITRRGVL